MSILFGIGAVTIVIDPYFHYHKPLSGFQYSINNQRYQNDGIIKHFDYNAIITGSSMTENFKASEFDDLFGVHSIKVPFSGGSFKEINNNLETAVKYNSDLKVIVRCLDHGRLLDSADAMRYEEDRYPKYLYDECLYNDVKYIFNKSILHDAISVICYTKSGGVTTNFDEYSNWMHTVTFGKEAVDAAYTRLEKVEKSISISKEDYKNIKENITQNVTELADRNPEIEYYIFFSPYSIYWWDELRRTGKLERQLDAEKYVIELMLLHENIHLFSFSTEYGMICDLNNYKDIAHYSEEINSQMLVWMHEGTHELTEDNYEEYCRQVKEFYMNYDYDSLFD